MEKLWTVELALLAVGAVAAGIGASTLIHGDSVIVVAVAWAIMLVAIFCRDV